MFKILTHPESLLLFKKKNKTYHKVTAPVNCRQNSWNVRIVTDCLKEANQFSMQADLMDNFNVLAKIFANKIWFTIEKFLY